MVRLPDVGERRPIAALRRPAPARRARARAGQPPARAAARRAARRARPEAAPGDAARAEVDPARAERADHVHLRHARPGRGADDERPHRACSPTGASSRSARRARSTSGRPTSSSPASSARRTCSSATGGVYTVRPEKIRLLDDGEPRPGRRCRAWCARSPTSARSRATSSSSTSGETIVVVRQNLDTSAEQALARTGQARAARLAGRRTRRRLQSQTNRRRQSMRLAKIDWALGARARR